MPKTESISSSQRLSKIIVARRRSMFRGAFLAHQHRSADIAADAKARRIGEIMLPLQDPTDLHRALQHDIIVRLEDLGVEIRRRVRVRVGRVRGTQGDHVVVDARVDEDASLRPALVEAIDAQRLHVDGADLDVEVLAQDVQLDEAAPRIFPLDPPAVRVRFLVQHRGGIVVRPRLDVLRDDGAQLVHVVHGPEVGRVEGAEEAGVVVGHDAQQECCGMGWEWELGGFGVQFVGFAG